ncbi:hypothetical protein LTS18_002695 [Coniosporium uncinatum]|uniref:Uncharacterized protein n=1 Tax=Coniosporium uncinatum TaxID=93489 RepID=A0ACC3DCN9_9PEZI|nr:hypothetical protein LTS18_002695 [Coniosporium uncinatum]
MALVIYFFGTLICLHLGQFIGAPLYFYNQEWYYAYMAMTKQHFELLVMTLTQWWSPTVIRVSGDASVRGQLMQTPDGRLVCDFPERMILIANHQIYTDWLYLWWTAYTNVVPTHGHVYIILKESLKWVPILGPGMQFFSFIFLSRKWAADQPRFQHRLHQLKQRRTHSDIPFSGGPGKLDPMWLLIFPEGTNLSARTRKRSAEWSAKSGTRDLKHQLLPRSTGLRFCLEEMDDSIDYLYDCTIAYEGVEHGQFAQDIFTLRSIYLQGRPPKSVNLHWRRWKVADLPVSDEKAFNDWILERFREKDELIDRYLETGRFPVDEDWVDKPGANGYLADGPVHTREPYVETQVRPASRGELLQIYAPVAGFLYAVAIIWNIWQSTADMLIFWR